MRRHLAVALLLCLGGSLAGAGVRAAPAAAAPSAACPPATGLAETLPCGDADLATAEAQVTAELASASAKLSGAGRARLRDDQAAWRKFLEALCLGGSAADPAETMDCLKQEYDLRRAQLARAVEVTGNVTLLRAERFELRPVPNPDGADHPVRLDIAWPVLDRAAGRGQTRWNEAMAKAAEALAQPPERDQPATDISVDYRIEAVWPGLIQTVFSRDLYIHGAEHGDDLRVSSLFLLREARPLAAEDLFDPAKSWHTALADAAFARLQAAAGSAGWQLWPKEPEDVASLAADPARWLLTRDGLAVHFDAYDVADYGAGPQEVVIPWRALTPLLKPAPAVKLPP
jgi:uncharacterized protein YecT (DUF1311 family)